MISGDKNNEKHWCTKWIRDIIKYLGYAGPQMTSQKFKQKELWLNGFLCCDDFEYAFLIWHQQHHSTDIIQLKYSLYGKGTYTRYGASSWIITSEVLRYGTCSQGISQFYLHTHTFIRNRNEPMSHTCLCLPSRSWYSFTDPGGMEGWVDLGADRFFFNIIRRPEGGNYKRNGVGYNETEDR